MPDPIAPPSASSAAEVVALVSLAISDGDLGAALAQYEPGAVLAPWAPGALATPQDLANSLAQLMELRLPLSVTVCNVLASSQVAAGADPVDSADLAVSTSLQASPVALVLADRRIAGTGPDCRPVDFRGCGATAARQQPDGSWRIAADAWGLASAADGQPVC
ncbi:MAG: YybH family protein [Streptosporangiaceae bacterium]